MPLRQTIPAPVLYVEKGLRFCSLAVEKLCDVTIVLLGSVVLLTMGLSIITRYIDFFKPFLWTDEVARYAMIWCAFLAASSAFKKGQFLKFDLLVNALPPKAAWYLDIISDVFVLVFIWVFLSSGIQTLPITFLQKSSALRLPMFYPYMALIVGTGFMALHLIYNLFCKCRFTLWGGEAVIPAAKLPEAQEGI